MEEEEEEEGDERGQVVHLGGTGWQDGGSQVENAGYMRPEPKQSTVTSSRQTLPLTGRINF